MAPCAPPWVGGKGNDVAASLARNRRWKRRSAASRLDPERAHELPGTGHEWDRDQAADDTTEMEAGEQRDEDDERVQAGGAPDEIRGEQLALDGLTSDHHDQREARFDEAVAEPRQHRQDGGEGRAEEGHDVEDGGERADEQGVLHADDRQHDRDQDADEEARDDLAADVAADPVDQLG